MTVLLDATDLRELRDAAVSAMADTCTVQRSTGHVPDGAGGYTDGYVSVGSWPCLVSLKNQGLRTGTSQSLEAGRIHGENRYEILLPMAATVFVDDQVVHQQSGQTFQAMATVTLRTDRAATQVDAVLTTNL